MNLLPKIRKWMTQVLKAKAYLDPPPMLILSANLEDLIKVSQSEKFKDLSLDLDINYLINYMAEEDVNRMIFWGLFAKDINQKIRNPLDTSQSFTPLMIAARYSFNLLQILIARGVDVNAEDEEKSTALMMAARHSQLESCKESIKALLKAGANASINVQTTTGRTALMLAAEFSREDSSEETVQMLIDSGAHVNLRSDEGKTALMMAAAFTTSSSTIETVKILIDAGSDINAQDEDGSTALLIASSVAGSTSSLETIQLLIDSGADVNIEINDGRTALMVASRFSRKSSSIEAVKLLIANKADVNHLDEDNCTALMMACGYTLTGSTLETVKVLIAAGADVNLQSDEGISALMFAIIIDESCNDTVTTLLEAGADVSLKTIDGRTAVDLAVSDDKRVLLGGVAFYSIMEKYNCSLDVAKLILTRNPTERDMDRHIAILDTLSKYRINDTSISGESFDRSSAQASAQGYKYPVDVVVGSNDYWYLMSEIVQLGNVDCPYTRIPLPDIIIVYSLIGSRGLVVYGN